MVHSSMNVCFMSTGAVALSARCELNLKCAPTLSNLIWYIVYFVGYFRSDLYDLTTSDLRSLWLLRFTVVYCQLSSSHNWLHSPKNVKRALYITGLFRCSELLNFEARFFLTKGSKCTSPVVRLLTQLVCLIWLVCQVSSALKVLYGIYTSKLA